MITQSETGSNNQIEFIALFSGAYICGAFHQPLGFFFQLCDVAKVAIILKMIEPNLATCTNMEVGKIKIFLYSWLRIGTTNKNLVIGKKKISKFGEFGPFFSWKILPTGRNHIFQERDLTKIRQ
jgi:hypothetical protein